MAFGLTIAVATIATSVTETVLAPDAEAPAESSAAGNTPETPETPETPDASADEAAGAQPLAAGETQDGSAAPEEASPADTAQSTTPSPKTARSQTLDRSQTPDESRTLDESQTPDRSQTPDESRTLESAAPSDSSPPPAAATATTDGGATDSDDGVAGEGILEPAEPLQILGETVEPGSLVRLELRTSESFSGAWLSTPVAIIHGRIKGPRLCIVAGIHGDEVNGVEVVRRTLTAVDPDEIHGSLLAVPIANMSAFRRGSRYLPDRRDLNRFFPGRPFGSSASRIAHGIFDRVIRNCDALVDLHTGSFNRSNLHQLRANLSDDGTAELSEAFGTEVVVNSAGRLGTLRRAATDVGIPAITVEAGESARFNAYDVEEALRGILRLMRAKGMINHDTDGPPNLVPTAYLRTRWVRADHGGILVSRVELGEQIVEGQTLGTISDPLSDSVTMIKTPLAGRIIGMALDQVVMPGFAAFHVAYDPHPLAGNLSAVDRIPEVATEEDLGGLDLEERPE